MSWPLNTLSPGLGFTPFPIQQFISWGGFSDFILPPQAPHSSGGANDAQQTCEAGDFLQTQSFPLAFPKRAELPARGQESLTVKQESADPGKRPWVIPLLPPLKSTNFIKFFWGAKRKQLWWSFKSDLSRGDVFDQIVYNEVDRDRKAGNPFLRPIFLKEHILSKIHWAKIYTWNVNFLLVNW